MSGNDWKCARCGLAPTLKKAVFTYLGHSFTHEVLRCPGCGKILIPPELAAGKMAEVEEQLEDK
jgi:hypothetical protein